MKNEEKEHPRSISARIIAECGTDYTKLKNAFSAALQEARNDEGKKVRNETLMEAESIAQKLAEKEQARGCDYEFPPAAFIEVAKAIAKLREGKK